MKRIVYLLCFGVTLLLPVSSGVTEDSVITPFQFKSFAANCLQLLQSGQWSQLASLYHAPRSVSIDPAREREEITMSLQKLGAVFGSPTRPEFSDAVVEIMQLTVEGLDQDYWLERSKFVQVSYRVDFSELGQGYVTFRIVLYANRMQLRSVSFGFPASDPETPRRMNAIRNMLQD